MKKNRLVVAVMAAMLAVLMLAAAGCSTAAPRANTQQDKPGELAKPQAPAADSNGAKADEGGTALPNIDVGNAAASGKKIIYTANIALEAKDAGAVMKDITDTVIELGGYVSNSQFAADSKTAASWITVRIAPEKLNAFTAHVGTLGRVLSQNLSSEDITGQYTDTQSWLRNAEAQEAQLQSIMDEIKNSNSADKTGDILKVREQLNTVQREIEQYKGQLRLWENLIGFSTVTISIQQPPPPAVVVDSTDEGYKFWGFEAVWQKILRGLSDGFNFTLNALSVILMGLAYAILPLAIAGGITIGIIALVRVAKKRKKKQTPQAPQTPQGPQAH